MSTSTSRSQYSRYLGDFRGVDFSSSPAMVEPNRFSYLKNLWKDYESEQGQAIETIPGFRVIMSDLEGLGTIHSIYEYRDAVMVKCGSFLFFCKYNEQKDRYCHDSDDDPETFNPIKLMDANGSISSLTLHDGEITAFVFNNDFWFLDGAEYYRYTYGQTYCVKVTDVAYVPTTYIDGEEYEQRNILTNRFSEKFFVGSDYAKVMDLTAATPQEDFDYELLEDNTVRINGCKTAHDVLVIPESINIPEGGVNLYRVVSVIKGNNFSGKDYSEGNSFVGYPARVISVPSKIQISEGAFQNCRSLETLIVRENKVNLSTNTFTVIQKDAFYQSRSLSEIVMFCEETTNSEGESVANLQIGDDAFSAGNASRNILLLFSLSESFLSKIENLPYQSSITGTKLSVNYIIKTVLSDPCETVSSVSKDFGDFVYHPIVSDEYVSCVRIFSDLADAGEEIQISCIGEYTKLSSAKNGNKSVYDANASYDSSTADSALNVFRKCTVTAIFDGRIFFTGNPDLPNTVLYSARDLTSANNPAYIGVYNYFNDGVGDKRNTAMISTPSMLVVCKENTKQDGSCWYHIGQDTGYDLVPRIYPSTQGVSGIGCVGAATNFSDDPVFLSTEGLMAIGKETVNLERTLEHRSSNVDLKLKQCNLKNAKMAEWKGYLVILAGGQIFLADSRQLFKHESGVTQYEWFYADDIGVYSGQKEMVSTTSGSIFATVDGEVIDITSPECQYTLTYSQNGGGTGIVYVNVDEDPVCYESDRIREPNATIFVDGRETNLKFPIVETDNGFYIAKYIDQYSGGIFQPAVSICETGGRLLLGTTNGMMICFNTDKRGKSVYRAVDVPESYDGATAYRNPDKDMYFENVSGSGMITVDEADYYPVTTGGVSYLTEKIEVNPDEIWHGYYSRNGRAIESVCETLCDSSAYPHIAKNTVRKSTVIRTKAMGTSEYHVFVRSNREQVWKQCRVTSRTGNASDTEFPNMSYLTNDIIVSVIPDRMKRWQWQQFRFESNGYCKPFGILDLFYRYENGGNVK